MLFVFIVANLPLPIIVVLNVLVTTKFLRLRREGKHKTIQKPERLIIGWWLNNLALPFTWVPVIVEQRLFVQNHYWLISYAIAAVLSISGLLLMNSGLRYELSEIEA